MRVQLGKTTKQAIRTRESGKNVSPNAVPLELLDDDESLDDDEGPSIPERRDKPIVSFDMPPSPIPFRTNRESRSNSDTENDEILEATEPRVPSGRRNEPIFGGDVPNPIPFRTNHPSSSRRAASLPSNDITAIAVPLEPEQDLPIANLMIERKRGLLGNFTLDTMRRFTTSILICVFIVALAITLIHEYKFRPPEDSDPFFPSGAPSAPSTFRNEEGFLDIIADFTNRHPNELMDQYSNDPTARAAIWIVNEDQREIERYGPELLTRFALATLYFSTNGWNWTDCSANFDDTLDICHHYVWFSSWNATGHRFLSEEHHCNWYGMECRESDQSLNRIHLSSNNLHGSIPSELSLIRSLEHVRIIDNFLTGTIPSELGMTSIVDIEVNLNFLSGEIPATILQNEQMSRLNLGDNMLSGTISTKIGKMVSLRGLFLHGNSFSGTIPTEVGNLKHLTFTRWSNNPLTGTLPSDFGRLTLLRELYLHTASFTGTLPEEYRNLQHLEDLLFYENDIRGTIDVVYDLKSISFLYAFDNMMTGTLDSRIGDLKDLSRLILRRNKFHGAIPNEIVPKPYNESKLSIAWFHFNDFTGTITNELCHLFSENLFQVYADCLQVDGEILAVECLCCTNCCDQQRICKELEFYPLPNN